MAQNIKWIAYYSLIFTFLLVFKIQQLRYIDFFSHNSSHSTAVILRKQSPSLDASWQTVLNSSSDILVYSAFLEERAILKYVSPVIRLIGAGKLKSKYRNEVVCRFWYDEENTSNDARKEDLVDGNIEAIREHWGLANSAVFIFCPLKDEKKLPTSVTLYAYNDVKNIKKSDDLFTLPKASNRVQVHRNIELNNATMAVCVAPISAHYSKTWEVIEWIEMNLLLGVTNFYLYDQDSSDNLKCILNDYASRGIVTLMDWNWDIKSYKSEVDIRLNNMFAAMNDCLYRGMHKHKYLAFFDFDEFLVPSKHEDLIKLMEDTDKKEANLSSLVFRNAFFYLQWPDDPDAKESHLITARKTRRKLGLNSAGERSKYICKPEEVMEVGNHMLWEARTAQMRQVILDPETGFMHHYRGECEFGGNSCLTLESAIDKRMWKWTNSLQAALSPLLQSICIKCELMNCAL